MRRRHGYEMSLASLTLDVDDAFVDMHQIVELCKQGLWVACRDKIGITIDNRTDNLTLVRLNFTAKRTPETPSEVWSGKFRRRFNLHGVHCYQHIETKKHVVFRQFPWMVVRITEATFHDDGMSLACFAEDTFLRIEHKLDVEVAKSDTVGQTTAKIRYAVLGALRPDYNTPNLYKTRTRFPNFERIHQNCLIVPVLLDTLEKFASNKSTRASKALKKPAAASRALKKSAASKALKMPAAAASKKLPVISKKK